MFPYGSVAVIVKAFALPAVTVDPDAVSASLVAAAGFTVTVYRSPPEEALIPLADAVMWSGPSALYSTIDPPALETPAVNVTVVADPNAVAEPVLSVTVGAVTGLDELFAPPNVNA